uniref:Apple domain-containing protein n=1 Tax=Pygocentrus nattereri TaxID=42514 RepID=A0A3B4DRA6_PYGNA
MLTVESLFPQFFSLQKLLENADFPGDDVLHIYSPDVHHCQLACTQHQSCLFFTFLRPDWDKDDRKFYCFLKYTDSGVPSQVSERNGATSGFSMSKPSVCLSSIYQDVDFPGSDYRKLPSSSYDECQKVCTRDPGCRLFSFTTGSFPFAADRKTCFLKYSWSVPIPPSITTQMGLVSGFSQSLPKAKGTIKEECKEEILVNTEFPGNDFEQVPAASPQHCQILCSIHPRCTHFSFSQSKSWHHMSCFLKYKPDVSKDESVKKEEVYSGFPTRNCKPSNVWGSRFEDIDFLGADNGHVFVDNADLCEDSCTADRQCQFYTYVLPSYPNLTPELRNKCHLKQVMTLPRPAKVISAKGVISGFSLKSCKDDSSEELRVDVDFPGDDVLQIYSPDVYHCQLACTEHHSCLFFTFLRPDWDKDKRKFYCYLKHTTSGNPSRVTELKGVTSGFALSHQEYKIFSCLPSIYHDVDFPQSDYRNLPSSSYEECQEACTSDPDCRFFSFATETFSAVEYRKMCFLKYSWSVPVPPVITTKRGLVSGFSQSLKKAKETSREECKEDILANSDFPGNDFEQVPAGSPQHCQILCSIHPRCTHFSFSQSRTWYQMSCFLKHKQYFNKDESVRKEGIYSGLRIRNCKPLTVWGRRFEDVDFYGADSSQAFVDNADICEDKCTADPRCQFYTYVLPSYPDLTPELRNKCHLKRVMTLPRPAKVVSVRDVVSGFSLRSCRD